MSDTILEDMYEVILDRKQNPMEGSYTCYLFEKGLDKILKKVGEESAETIIAAKNDVPEDTVGEINDLFYHVLVMMAELNIPLEDVLAEILGQDLSQYAEIVFCGYGEPTCRLDDLLWICDRLHAAHRPDLPPIRLNTNGHASLINHRDVTPELQGRLDAVSVSLNASNAADYLAITRPGAGEAAWQAMLDFVRDARKYVPKVMVSIVDYDKTPQEIEACRHLAESLGAIFRVRPFAG